MFWQKSRYNNNLDENMRIANNILEIVRRRFQIGSSNISPIHHSKLNDSYVFNKKLHDYQKKNSRWFDALIDANLKTLSNQIIAKNREKISALIEKHKEEPSLIKRQLVRINLAVYSESSGAGNCEELATYAFLKVEEEYPNKNAEFMVFEYPIDHAFIVIGRDQKTNVSNRKSWNKESVFIVPWLGHCFSVSEFEKTWENNQFNCPAHKLVVARKFDINEFFSSNGNSNRPNKSLLKP
jgi:hypothetical protein